MVRCKDCVYYPNVINNLFKCHPELPSKFWKKEDKYKEHDCQHFQDAYFDEIHDEMVDDIVVQKNKTKRKSKKNIDFNAE